MNKTRDVRTALYQAGVQTATEFLELNGLEVPMFVTYQEVADGRCTSAQPRQVDFFRRAVHLGLQGAATGRYTGLYYDNWAFINVPHTALPVQKPVMRSWSWPGWKTDRTALGVCAHETGHHTAALWGPGLIRAWREHLKLKARGRHVSGYEPTADEAWAETLRLFILNPDLARQALPWRCEFIEGSGIKPLKKLVRQGWRKVLGNVNYFEAAERWISNGGVK